MCCRCLIYVSTQYDNVSCRCSVAKPIVRLSEQPRLRNLRALALHVFAFRLCTNWGAEWQPLPTS